MMGSKFALARWVTADDERALKGFIESNAHRIAYDAVGAPTFLAAYQSEISVAQEHWKDIRFHSMREHAGLVFQNQ